jgi:uracil phosphoribosyltransferase
MQAKDAQHREIAFRSSEIDHRYGAGVHIMADPVALTLLARLGAKGGVQPGVSRLLEHLYRTLAQTVLAVEFPRQISSIPTRMIDATPLGVWSGQTVRDDTPTVVVALARAGLLPSQITYDFLNQVLEPGGVRQDHLSLERLVDASGRVIGASLGAAKIGGAIERAMVLIPDPMGATGTTVSTALARYRATVPGRALKTIAMHLIITPEYLRHVARHHPDVIVYALRLDRGLSAADVLETIPGTRWDEERGLDDRHYIVPGAGGLGEVLNNSYV